MPLSVFSLLTSPPCHPPAAASVKDIAYPPSRSQTVHGRPDLVKESLDDLVSRLVHTYSLYLPATFLRTRRLPVRRPTLALSDIIRVVLPLFLSRGTHTPPSKKYLPTHICCQLVESHREIPPRTQQASILSYGGPPSRSSGPSSRAYFFYCTQQPSAQLYGGTNQPASPPQPSPRALTHTPLPWASDLQNPPVVCISSCPLGPSLVQRRRLIQSLASACRVARET